MQSVVLPDDTGYSFFLLNSKRQALEDSVLTPLKSFNINSVLIRFRVRDKETGLRKWGMSYSKLEPQYSPVKKYQISQLFRDRLH